MQLYNLYMLHQSNIIYNILQDKMESCKHIISKQVIKVVLKEPQKHIPSSVP